MEIWNTRRLKAPPTYTYQSKIDEVDIDHLRATLQDGINFYKEQYLLNLETALLARIVYRMKRKFRNSKDFQTLEKVKKDLMIYLQINIYKKLELLLSILSTKINQNKVTLPTKNMMDFILVRLQGVGKILCRVIEMCKLTVRYYECRLHLGHFWQLALVAIGLVSRIHILALNIIKFTCLLYIRLLPFSHKLKNSGVEWLPEDYILPKDLKEWLNVEWSKLDEVIEIPDKDFNFSLIDLVEDSDDDVQFCEEYIELNEDEDVEIIEEFKKINKRIKPIDYERNLIILRGFSSDQIDIGEVVSSPEKNYKEEDIQFISNDELPIPRPINIPNQLIHVKEKKNVSIEEIDIGELISSSDEENESSKIPDIDKFSETPIDTCTEVHDQVSEKSILESNQKQTRTQIEADVLISSSDEEQGDMSSNDSVEFVEEVTHPSKRQNIVTSDFISLNTKNDCSMIQCNKGFLGGISRKPSRNKPSINEIIEDLLNENIGDLKQNPTQNTLNINSTLKNDDNCITVEGKHSSIIELIDTPREKTHAGMNYSEEISKELIEISENTLNESIQNTPLSVKRKRNWKNGSRSKKPRWSNDVTLDIADKSGKITSSNMFSETGKQNNIQSLCEVPETPESSIGDINQNNCSANESFLFYTSTPVAKKRKRTTKNNKSKDIIYSGDTDKISPTKQRLDNISYMKQKFKKRNKRVNKKNKMNIVDSQSSQDNTVHSVLTSSNINTSSNSNIVNTSSTSVKRSKKMNRSKKKRLNNSGQLKMTKEFEIESAITPKKKRPKS